MPDGEYDEDDEKTGDDSRQDAAQDDGGEGPASRAAAGRTRSLRRRTVLQQRAHSPARRNCKEISPSAIFFFALMNIKWPTIQACLANCCMGQASHLCMVNCICVKKFAIVPGNFNKLILRNWHSS